MNRAAVAGVPEVAAAAAGGTSLGAKASCSVVSWSALEVVGGGSAVAGGKDDAAPASSSPLFALKQIAR